MEWLGFRVVRMKVLGRFVVPLVAVLVMVVSLVLIPGVRASADSWIQGFVRDAAGNLDVNVAGGAGSGTSSPAYTRIQDATSSTTAVVAAPTSDGVATSNNALFTGSFLYAFNGVSLDRIRTPGSGLLSTAPCAVGGNCANIDATGTMRVANGGASNLAVAAAAGTVVVKASSGRLVSILITAAGTAATTCYDNASAASGTIIGITPATTTVGTVYNFNMPATNGVTCSNPASSAGFTISYN